MLADGPRKPNVFRGLASSQEAFEQAVGQLFLAGVVQFVGAKKGRLLSRRTKR